MKGMWFLLLFVLFTFCAGAQTEPALLAHAVSIDNHAWKLLDPTLLITVENAKTITFHTVTMPMVFQVVSLLGTYDMKKGDSETSVLYACIDPRGIWCRITIGFINEDKFGLFVLIK